MKRHRLISHFDVLHVAYVRLKKKCERKGDGRIYGTSRTTTSLINTTIVLSRNYPKQYQFVK